MTWGFNDCGIPGYGEGLRGPRTVVMALSQTRYWAFVAHGDGFDFASSNPFAVTSKI